MPTKEEISKAGKILASTRTNPGHPIVWRICSKCGKVVTGWGARYACFLRSGEFNPKHLEIKRSK